MNTTRFLRVLFLLLPLAALAAPRMEGLGFDVATASNCVANAYIAPENMFLFRMRYPNGTYREFDRDYAQPTVLRSGDGWRGRIAGDRIVVKTGPRVKGGPATFAFEKGRLVGFKQGEQALEFPYDAPRAAAGATPPYYFGDEPVVAQAKPKKGVAKKMDAQVARELANKWRRSGRLAWPFQNPNENGFLYASCAMLAALLVFVPRTAAKIAGGALFLAACVPLVMTASRGAFLALAVGLLPVMALRARALLRSKRFWLLAALVLALGAGWFLTHNSRLLTRGFSGASTWSNQVRFEMWKATPQMIAEAPGGWYFAHVGRAYMDWYSPLETVAMPGSLMNEHLTRLAAYGWFGRFAYLFAWLFGLAVLGVWAWRTKNAVAFGTVLMYAVASWFNPVLTNWLLWIVPLVTLAASVAVTRPWRGIRARTYAGCALAAALVTAGALAATWYAGTRERVRGYPVCAEQNRVYVKTRNPGIWLVDDGHALGGVMACKDIRGYYVYDSSAPGIGYVRDVKDLPRGKIHRLVLAGEAVAEWLKMFGSRIEAEQEAALKDLPDELVLITPTIVPSDIPAPYFENCKVRLVIGEFTARYEPEYATPPDWITIVPAAELYIPGWMRFVVGN